MSNINWFKIKVDDGDKDPHTYIGSSVLTLDEMAKKIQRNEWIKLEQLLYQERGEFKELEEWDKSIYPFVFINPVFIYSFMVYKGDPRIVSRK